MHIDVSFVMMINSELETTECWNWKRFDNVEKIGLKLWIFIQEIYFKYCILFKETIIFTSFANIQKKKEDLIFLAHKL